MTHDAWALYIRKVESDPWVFVCAWQDYDDMKMDEEEQIWGDSDYETTIQPVRVVAK